MKKQLLVAAVGAAVINTGTISANAAGLQMPRFYDGPVSDITQPGDVAVRGYLKIPFGARVQEENSEVKYGIAVSQALPRKMNNQFAGQYGSGLDLVNIRFDSQGFENLSFSGSTAVESKIVLNQNGTFGRQENYFWTFGIMAAALGAGAAVVLLSSGDENDFVPPEPDPDPDPTMTGTGTGTGTMTGTGSFTGMGVPRLQNSGVIAPTLMGLGTSVGYTE